MPDLPPLNLASYRAQMALRRLAERLRGARRRRGLTHHEAALLAGIRLASYRRLERADGAVPARDLVRALSLLTPADDALAETWRDLVNFPPHAAEAKRL